jgi:adenylylsulfate kinase
LYRKALAGELTHFTGISDPYEAPLHAEVTVDSSTGDEHSGVEQVWAKLLEMSLVRHG